MANIDKDTLRFIDRLYKELYLSEDVLKHSSGNRTDKFKNLEEYFDMQENMHERAMLKKSRKDILKRLYHERYVIKPEDIPESHYEMQQQMALERGYGHITIDDSMKRELQKEVIDNQGKSLDTWLDYFLSEDSSSYPFWAKYWAFQGMLKLGKYNKEEEKFSTRTKTTTAPFIELNREALAISIDMLMKSLQKETIDDHDLELLVQTGSFSKIYAYVLNKVLSNNENIIKRNQGQWVKYEKGSNPKLLVDSLIGYNTGWCTAGETTAAYQLERGDFYVYYTLDENNEYKVPRIAIRMENYEIGEIRGIGPHQELEPKMESVVLEKIKDFPNNEKYFKKVADMRNLTRIYNKFLNKEELTFDELKFVYEIDSEIVGFGYQKDPRISEITSERDSEEDYALLFNCTPDEIAFEYNKITEKTKVYVSDIIKLEKGKKVPEILWVEDVYYNYDDIEKELIFPRVVKGNIYVDTSRKIDKIVLPEKTGGDIVFYDLEEVGEVVANGKICGDLIFHNLTKAKKIDLSGDIEGYITIRNLKEVEELKFPEVAKGDIKLDKLESLKGVTLPKIANDDLWLPNIDDDPKDIKLPEIVRGTLSLGVKKGEGLELPKFLGKHLLLNKIVSGKGLILPKELNGALTLYDLETGDGLVLSEVIKGDCVFHNLRTTKGITFPKKVLGNFSIGYDSASEVVEEKIIELPEEVGGNFAFNSLRKVGTLILPKKLGFNRDDGSTGSIDLENLYECDKIIYPESKINNIFMSSLEYIGGVEFPEEIEGTLYLISLLDARGVKFPRKLKNLCLNGLKSAEGVEFPEDILEDLELEGLETLEGFTQPKVGGVVVLPKELVEKNSNDERIKRDRF